MQGLTQELLILRQFVVMSSYREKVFKSIGKEVKIPSIIAKDSGIRIAHISKILSDLKERNLVECINEEARKGRLYQLTDKGLEVLEAM